tara:strand:+ start:1119 stop:1256 length:138 start_codon:yes stop_codon:yes gene_type:complete
MNAKHIFLIVILFFCGVSLNAQSEEFKEVSPESSISKDAYINYEK